jgi:hypothetical protein
MRTQDQRPPLPRPHRMGPETFGIFTEPGLLVSLAIFAVFFVAFALLMLVLTGKL